MSAQGWLRDWSDWCAERENKRMTPDEENDCELAVLRLVMIGLKLRIAVVKHDRGALHILVDKARQQLQVLACSAESFPPDEPDTK